MRSIKLLAGVTMGACIAAACSAQVHEIRVRNDMRSIADVTMTPISGGGNVIRFAARTDVEAVIRFTGSVYEIQVVPRDAPDTGSIHQNVPLADIAAGSGYYELNGVFAPDKQRVVCRPAGLFGRRCKCCVVTIPGERTAIGLLGIKSDGTEFRSEVSVMPYDSN